VPYLRPFRLALEFPARTQNAQLFDVLGVILAVTTLVVVMSVVAGLNFYVAGEQCQYGVQRFYRGRFGIIPVTTSGYRRKSDLYNWMNSSICADKHEDRQCRRALDDSAKQDVKAGNERPSEPTSWALRQYTEVRNIGGAQGA